MCNLPIKSVNIKVPRNMIPKFVSFWFFLSFLTLTDKYTFQLQSVVFFTWVGSVNKNWKVFTYTNKYHVYHVEFMCNKICRIITLEKYFSYVVVSCCLVQLVNKNRKLNQIVRLSQKMVWAHPSQVRFFVVSVWVDFVCDFSIELVRFWTPLSIMLAIVLGSLC